MIKFEHVVLPSPEQMEFDIEGVRNAFRSWDRMDSGKCAEVGCNDKCPYFVKGETDEDDDCDIEQLKKAESLELSQIKTGELPAISSSKIRF